MPKMNEVMTMPIDRVYHLLQNLPYSVYNGVSVSEIKSRLPIKMANGYLKVLIMKNDKLN